MLRHIILFSLISLMFSGCSSSPIHYKKGIDPPTVGMTRQNFDEMCPDRIRGSGDRESTHESSQGRTVSIYRAGQLIDNERERTGCFGSFVFVNDRLVSISRDRDYDFATESKKPPENIVDSIKKVVKNTNTSRK